MSPDFKDLLSILNADNVRYLVVGGYAVSLHAQPRATKDLDILIKPDRANAAALFRALAKFGAPLEGLAPDDFTQRGSFFRMGTPPLMVDILPEIAGVDFDRAWRRRVVETIDANTGLKASFISADDLIAAKVASGRAQDLGYGILDTRPEDCFDQLVRAAAALFAAPIGLVSLVDDRRVWFKARIGLDASEVPRADAFCDHALLTGGAAMVVPNAHADPRFRDNLLVVGEPHVSFYAGVWLTASMARSTSKVGWIAAPGCGYRCRPCAQARRGWRHNSGCSSSGRGRRDARGSTDNGRRSGHANRHSSAPYRPQGKSGRDPPGRRAGRGTRLC